MKNDIVHGPPPQLSIVVPVFDEEGNIQPLLEAIRKTLAALGITYEVILVDDGSGDGTWALIKQESSRDDTIKGVSLSRNFGQQNAIFTGLHYCSGGAIITMDGDLQHPPETIPELFEAWRQGFKVVETSRIQSEDVSFFKRHTSRAFYRVFSLLSGMPLSKGSSDFRLIDAKVAEAIIEMRDTDLFLRGISHWVGFPRKTISYKASIRHTGKTKFGTLKMIRFAVSSLFSFSTIPLRMGIWLGLFTSVLAFAELLYIFIRYLQGASVPGWASTLTVISFMFGVLFIMVGILGAYLGSIFETVKRRPRFLVNETSGLLRDP